MLDKLNLRDIKDKTLLSIIDEHLFNNGIVIIENHTNNFFDWCVLGVDYKFMYIVDIDIYFEKSNDEDYPIKISYDTTYTHTRYVIDYISKELFDKRI